MKKAELTRELGLCGVEINFIRFSQRINDYGQMLTVLDKNQSIQPMGFSTCNVISKIE